MITRLPDCLRRKLVRRLGFLQTDNVGLGFAKPVQQFGKRRLTLLMLKLAIFIGSATDKRHGLAFSAGPKPPPIQVQLRPLVTHVPFHLNGSFTISCEANNQEVGVILCMIQYRTVVHF
jgi:hypothetical protein